MSQLELNKGDNFIFAIDVSASMQATDTPSGQMRIDYLKEKVNVFIGEAAKWDEDGIDVITFGHSIKSFEGVTPDKAKDIIAPLKASEGSTDTAGAIAEAWKLHRKANKAQTVLFLATDGEPNDQQAVFDRIAAITKELRDEHEFAISFLTVGKPNGALEAFLKRLDDDLPGAKYDIVDVKNLDDVDFMAAFAGALHD